MAPLIVLVVAAIAFWLVGLAGVVAFQDPGAILRTSLGLMFLLTASAHWGKRRQDLIRMVPPAFPRPDLLARLLGETNPFPVIRIPWDRDNPWQSVFLHECAHNLQADMRIWHENGVAVAKRVLTVSGDPRLSAVYARWHKEIFADLAALLLGGRLPRGAWPCSSRIRRRGR